MLDLMGTKRMGWNFGSIEIATDRNEAWRWIPNDLGMCKKIAKVEKSSATRFMPVGWRKRRRRYSKPMLRDNASPPFSLL